jgi:hypothetical protein
MNPQEGQSSSTTPQPTQAPVQAAPAPVVPDVKIPKVNMPQGLLAPLNAFSIVFAAFFGVVSVFGAIAAFTAAAKTSWSFGIPLINTFNTTSVSTLFVTAFVAAAFAVIGFITLKKITDAEALKKSYATASNVLTIVAVILTSITVATILYALLALGKSSGVSQGPLWLNSFLPVLIMTAMVIGAKILTKKVADGNTALLRVFGLIALGAGGLGFILVIVATLVGFYGSGSSSTSTDSIYDLMKYFN